MPLSADPPSPPPPRGGASLAWVVVLLLVGAGGAVAATATYYAIQPTSTPGSVHLTDDLGRSVSVPYDPHRVAVLSPSIMDIMFRLGLRDRVVGVDCYAAADGGLSADYSPDQIALWNLSTAMCIQVGPSFVASLLVGVDPQLVLASTIISVSAVQEISNNLHVPVVILQPPTLSGILVDDDLVGEVFGVSSAANALNGRLQAELFNATNLTSTVNQLPTVLVTYSVDASGYWTFGPGTFGTSLIELAGGASISASATVPYPELPASAVLLDNPRDIVYGTGFGLNESFYATAPDWNSLGAVVAGNLTGIDSNWLTEPDPSMVLDGLPALQAAFYPALV
jgi:iron complex transport system substrate-binding protein